MAVHADREHQAYSRWLPGNARTSQGRTRNAASCAEASRMAHPHVVGLLCSAGWHRLDDGQRWNCPGFAGGGDHGTDGPRSRRNLPGTYARVRRAGLRPRGGAGYTGTKRDSGKTLAAAGPVQRVGGEKKIYAESFRGADHLRQILEEAQTIVSDALAASDPGKKS